MKSNLFRELTDTMSRRGRRNAEKHTKQIIPKDPEAAYDPGKRLICKAVEAAK